MSFFSLIIFITALQCNIEHFLVNRVCEPLIASKIAVTLELKLCQSNFSREIERQNEGYEGTNITSIFTVPADLFLIPYSSPIFDNF